MSAGGGVGVWGGGGLLAPQRRSGRRLVSAEVFVEAHSLCEGGGGGKSMAPRGRPSFRLTHASPGFLYLSLTPPPSSLLFPLSTRVPGVDGGLSFFPLFPVFSLFLTFFPSCDHNASHPTGIGKKLNIGTRLSQNAELQRAAAE